MKAGLSRLLITPPVGTRMMGYGDRDINKRCTGVHDDLYVRALYLEHEGEEALIIGFDLCFLGREEADRVKGAIGRKTGYAPSRILLNASHTHNGPATHRWSYGDFVEPACLYVRDLTDATVRVACEAREAAQEVTLWAGMTRSELPVSRRRKDEKGVIRWAPWDEGAICDALPVCFLKGMSGEPVCLLFSVSCHASTMKGWEISADYPGVAMEKLDTHLGAPVSLFLQGAGGDAKPRSCADYKNHRWPGSWEAVEKGGAMAAEEVTRCIEGGLAQVEPAVRVHSFEASWPLAPHLGRSGYEAVLRDSNAPELRRMWAQRQIYLMDMGVSLPTSAPVTTHGVQIGQGVRLIGLEGEPVADIGNRIISFYGDGVTFPLGYTDGAQLYLPTDAMLDEGGYEVDSYWEYGFPSPLAKGLDAIVEDSLMQLRAGGIG